MNPIEMSRNLADALATAGTEYVYAEVDATHEGARDLAATRDLISAFLGSHLHPAE